jgi:hypothetical protein
MAGRQCERGDLRLNDETSTRRRGFTVTVGRCTIRDSRGLVSSAQMNNELLARGTRILTLHRGYDDDIYTNYPAGNLYFARCLSAQGPLSKHPLSTLLLSGLQHMECALFWTRGHRRAAPTMLATNQGRHTSRCKERFY